MHRDRLEDFGLIAERIKRVLNSPTWYEVMHRDENLWFEKYHHCDESKKSKKEVFRNLDNLLTEMCWMHQSIQSLYELARFGKDTEDRQNPN